MSVTLFVLDVADFRPIAEAAAKLDGVEVVKRGPYFELSSERGFEIERRTTGCRNAVWFSSVAAIRTGHVSSWDKAGLRVEPGSSGARAWRRIQATPEESYADLERDVT